MVDGATTKGPKLRTKTGCITCRSRRKKCDEQYPLCGRCSSSGRECTWPTREALTDRRYGSRNTKNSPTPAALMEARAHGKAHEQSLVPLPTCNALSLDSEAISQRQFLLEIEPVVAKYFVDIYFNLIINPESHPDFYQDWLDDLQAKMKSFKALRYSALANAASHIATADESDGMYELGINFYSRSIRGLSEALAANNRCQDQYAILMTVMLLYIHGQLETATYGDLTFHLRAATRIIKLKFLQDPDLILTQSFDRLAVESVMLQIFLLAAGPWSSTEKNGFEFDVKFWLDCEALLSRSTMYPGRSTSCNSPVLGIPISLFKLNLTTKRMCEDLRLCNAETLAYIQQDVAHWEAAISLGQRHPTAPRSLCDDATFLYILIASLLAAQLKHYANDGGQPPPHAASKNDWQLREMLSILRRRHEDNVWHRTFITNWPVYSVGVFVKSEADKRFIREVMQRRWTQSSVSMAQRTMKDLETFWARGEAAGPTAMAFLSPADSKG